VKSFLSFFGIEFGSATVADTTDAPKEIPLPKEVLWIDQIVNGHGWEEHGHDFQSKEEYKQKILETVQGASGQDVQHPGKGRTLFWNDKEGFAADMTLRIPSAWPVFVLDDSDQRIAWFRQRVPQAVVAKTASQARSILEENKFKIVFLDHDLGFLDAADPHRLYDNGKEVARYLAIRNFEGIVVIHSLNAVGAIIMQGYLPQARLEPFGTFDIEQV
jgi:hypothetical protein